MLAAGMEPGEAPVAERVEPEALVEVGAAPEEQVERVELAAPAARAAVGPPEPPGEERAGAAA